MLPNDTGTKNYATGVITGFQPADWYAGWDGDLPGVNPGNPTEQGTDPNTPTWLWGSRHPYIVTNVYRLNAQGRLEQLAASWIKHGWYAASVSQGAVAGANGQPQCGTGSCSGIGNNALGANCSDTYGAGLNADRQWLGPRTEVKANKAFNEPGWSIPGSWLTQYNYNGNTDVSAAIDGYARSYTNSGTGQSWKLCQVRMSEVDASANGLGPSSGFGRLFVEGYYVVNGDNYKFNNFAHRRFTFVQPAGGLASAMTASNMSFDGQHTYGPAILSWNAAGLNVPGTFRNAVAQPVAGNGTVYVASRVVDLGGGQWRYEYNVLNADFDREVSSFEVPIPAAATLTGLGFWQPKSASPGYHGFNVRDPQNTLPGQAGFLPNPSTNWAGSYDSAKGRFVWAPPAPPSQFLLPNTIRWGTMYTFWFTSNLPPNHSGTVAVTGRLPGTAELTATGISVPRNPADIASSDGTAGPDGFVNNGDFQLFFTAFFLGCETAGTPCSPADIASSDGSPTPDGQVDNGDFQLFFSMFFGG
jgi:hypothetical protein